MRFEDIKITKAFRQTNPNKDKVNKAKKYIIENNKLDKPIIISSKGYLIDGYARYVALEELDFSGSIEGVYLTKEDINTEPNVSQKVETYVYGKHIGNENEYVWKIPSQKKDSFPEVGDIALVQTKYGNQKVVVTKVETTNICPVKTKIKKVIMWWKKDS